MKWYPSLFFFSIVFLWILPPARSQEIRPSTRPPITLSGKIIDSMTARPLESATVQLADPLTHRVTRTTTTDQGGLFRFRGLAPGTYLLSVAFIGYRPFVQKDTVSGSTKQDQFLPVIALGKKEVLLQNVVVTGSRRVIENKADRLVYHVAGDVTAQGGTATDILRKVPQVTVDINGNVELLGNSSVRFLINGKPSTIFGNNITDALESIPASEIESIEVMSSPGAQYDASGTGGIINIVLKKNKANGFSGTVNATVGTRLDNASLNLNFRKKNINITGYFSGSSQLKATTATETERTTTDTASGNHFYLEQNGHSDFTRSGYRSGLGLDWEISKKDNLSLSLGHTHFGNAHAGSSYQQNAEMDPSGNDIQDEYSKLLSNDRFNNYAVEIGVDYRRKLKKEKQELALSYHYSSGRDNTRYAQSQQYPDDDSVFAGSASFNPGRDHLSTFSIDYADPLSAHFLLETGARTEIESLISNADVYSFAPAAYQYVLDSGQSYTSEFRRQVYAGYVSGSFTLFHYLNIIAGARFEHAHNHPRYSNVHDVNIPDYNNFAPSVTILHRFNELQNIKFSYAYRLERPDYRDLNPFVNLSDPHNIFTGNPYLRPEIGNDFQLGYDLSLGGDNSLDIILLFTHNNPDIKTYTTFYPAYQVGDSVYTNVNLSTRNNIAAENKWGFNISGSLKPASKLSIRANIQVLHRQTKNIYSVPPVITGFEYRGSFNANYRFPHDLVAEAFGNYRSGIVWQGRKAAFASYTLAIRKLLFKGKGSIGLTAVNAFGKYLTQTSTQTGTGFSAVDRLRIPYRSFGLSFMYKLGRRTLAKSKEEENYLNQPPAED